MTARERVSAEIRAWPATREGRLPATQPRRPGSGSVPPLSLADVTEDLFAWFSGRFGLATIARMVRHCHRELEIVHNPASMEALERLCLQRLQHRIPMPSATAAPGIAPRRNASGHRPEGQR